MAWASMGSPSTVPVPWASTTSTSSAPIRALASAWRITRCWASPLGAVSPLEAPSWLTAEPRTMPHTWWPWRRASDRRSTTSTPTPSDQATPSALDENDLQRPSAARAGKPAKYSGVFITVTPPASARSQSPARRAWPARWSATSDDEHAVSSVTAGPSRPST
jgi:hypothetical protein